MLKDELMQALRDMDQVTKLFETVDFDIYFLGGAACILGGYTDRATRDFDFIDLSYDAKMGRVFSMLRAFDMLEYEATVLPPDYKDRAKKLDEFKNFNGYILSPEDILVSKMIRMEEKDVEDVNSMLRSCDFSLIREIVSKVEAREDLYSEKKATFLRNWRVFQEKYHV